MWALKGIPSFHNGLYLGGWIFGENDSFTMMQTIPKCSLLGHDEASGTAGRNFHQSLALQALLALGVNIRKKDVHWYLIGRKWENLPRELLDDCDTAIELLPPNVRYNGLPPDLPSWENPNHMQLHWQGWNGKPYRKMKDRQKERRQQGGDYDPEMEDGFGPADFARRLMGDEARVAYALTDSFRLADLPGFLSNREEIRENLRGTRKEMLNDKESRYTSAVFEWTAMARDLAAADELRKDFVGASEIADLSGLPANKIGEAVGALGVPRYRNKGYPIMELIKVWEERTRGKLTAHGAGE